MASQNETPEEKAEGGVGSQGDSQPAEEVKDRILRAGERILRSQGWRGITVSALCAEAKVYRGAITYHFGSMEGFESAMLDRVYHTSIHRILGSVSSAPFGDERVRQTISEFGMLGGRDANCSSPLSLRCSGATTTERASRGSTKTAPPSSGKFASNFVIFRLPGDLISQAFCM